MAVRWYLRLEQRDCLAAACLAEVMKRQAGPLTGMHRRVTLHVGQREVRFAVAAVGVAEQGEKRRVLRERENLAVAEGPALGREVEGEDANLSDKWVGHRFSP